MRNWTKSLAGAGVAALIAASAASPAQAQIFGRDYDGRYDRYDRDDGIDLGDIAAGVAIIGGAAIAIDALTNGNDRGRYYSGNRYAYGNAYGSGYGYGYADPRAAVNACVSVARRYGQVERITDLDRQRNGTYRVRGNILVRDHDYNRWGRSYDFDRDDFTCYVQGNRVYDFRV